MNTKIQNLSSTITKSFESIVKTKPSTSQKSSSENKPQTDYTQDLLDIADIIGGLVITKSGDIIKILEILPLNFNEYDASVKDSIATSFGFGIKTCPKLGHIKIMRSTADITPFVNYVRTQMETETNAFLRSRVEDYLSHSVSLQSEQTLKNRFFYIFEYEGDASGKKSNNWQDIYEQMYQTSCEVANALGAGGNYVIDYHTNSSEIASILYSHFNPLSSKKEDFNKRVSKVVSAANYVSAETNRQIIPHITDYFAPRGMHFGKFDYVVMDGVFHTYLALQSESFPLQSYAGQLTQYLMSGLNDCDLDIYFKKKPRESTMKLLEKTSQISRGVAMNFQGDESKVAALSSTAASARYLKDCMSERDEELYDVAIILTIRAESQKELRFTTETYKKRLQASSYYFTTCALNVFEFWKMVQPLTYINHTIFSENARNMTNSSLATLYPFSSFEMFDPKGFCMGKTVNPSTLFSINNFDAKKYPNPHMFLIGTSGAGKTFTMDMLTSRMRMTGTRIIYILPLKGHEYKRCVNSLGGEFISLRPGSETCVNILEIRPEGEAHTDGIDDEETLEDLNARPSLMAKKITSIITWLRLLVNEDKFDSEELGEINELLTKLYASFGITSNNNSIYDDNGNIKTMPILGDLYEMMVNHPSLSRRASVLKAWVSGNNSNMNGQTNVDLSNKCIAFDINEDYIGEDMLPAYMYIAFDCGYDLCKKDDEEYCSIVLDEVWKLLKIPACAKQVFKMVKILRAYNSAAITATQDIDDCLNNEYGRAILTNSAIKIFLKVTKEEFDVVEKSVKFSEYNKQSILNAPKGRGFITFNTEKVFVDFNASEYEEYLYTTNPERRKELKSILQARGNLVL